MESDPDDRIVHRQIDIDRSTPTEAVVEIVAETEGVPQHSLDPLWTVADHMIAELFSTPPSPEAQMTVTFSYEGYRIEIEQNGRLRLIKPE